MEALLDAVATLPLAALVGLVLVLSFGESAFMLDLLVPGEAGAIVVSAALAGRDEGGLPLLIGACSLGAMAGDSVSFWIGDRFGRRLLHRWKWLARRMEPKVERAERYFERRGGFAVFAARWVGALRAVVPMVAGIGRMPYRRFVAWDAPAAILWSSVVATLGWYFGRDAAELVDRYAWVLSALAISGLAIWFGTRHIRHRSRQAVRA